MQTLIFWSLTSFPLLISGFVLEVLGIPLSIINTPFRINGSLIIVVIVFKLRYLMVYFRCSFFKTFVHFELYVSYIRSIWLTLNRYLLSCEFRFSFTFVDIYMYVV